MPPRFRRCNSGCKIFPDHALRVFTPRPPRARLVAFRQRARRGCRRNATRIQKSTSHRCGPWPVTRPGAPITIRIVTGCDDDIRVGNDLPTRGGRCADDGLASRIVSSDTAKTTHRLWRKRDAPPRMAAWRHPSDRRRSFRGSPAIGIDRCRCESGDLPA